MNALMKGAAAAVLLCAAQAMTAAQPAVRPAFDVVEKTIPELQEAMRAGTVTSAQLVDTYLARIEAYDRTGPRINAIIAINPKAREEAAAFDRERAARGPRGPLHGIPLVIKDNIDMAGLPTTAGSLAFSALFPADDADPVRKLGEGRAPKRYRDGLKADALKGARIGVLRNLFGTAPEDNEAGNVVRQALS